MRFCLCFKAFKCQHSHNWIIHDGFLYTPNECHHKVRKYFSCHFLSVSSFHPLSLTHMFILITFFPIILALHYTIDKNVCVCVCLWEMMKTHFLFLTGRIASWLGGNTIMKPKRRKERTYSVIYMFYLWHSFNISSNHELWK